MAFINSTALRLSCCDLHTTSIKKRKKKGTILFKKVAFSKDGVDDGLKDWYEDEDENWVEGLHLVWLKDKLTQSAIHTCGLKCPPGALCVSECVCEREREALAKYTECKIMCMEGGLSCQAYGQYCRCVVYTCWSNRAQKTGSGRSMTQTRSSSLTSSIKCSCRQKHTHTQNIRLLLYKYTLIQYNAGYVQW